MACQVGCRLHDGEVFEPRAGAARVIVRLAVVPPVVMVAAVRPVVAAVSAMDEPGVVVAVGPGCGLRVGRVM